MDKKKPKERRKNRRYSARKGAVAAVGAHMSKLGQIVDISMGGLAFKYQSPAPLLDKQHSFGNTDNTLFLSSPGCYVADLPFREIADYPAGSPDSRSSSEATRKIHIQFKDLNFKQIFDLDCYIRRNKSAIQAFNHGHIQ